MKKIIKRITALLTCAAMLSSAAALQASAWGLRETGSLIPAETWEDHGMLRDRFWVKGEYCVPAVVCPNDLRGEEEPLDYEDVWVGIQSQRKNCLTFIVRPDLDLEDAVNQTLTVIRKYYPDVVRSFAIENPVTLRQEYDECFQPTRILTLVDETETAGSAEIADALMHDLAAKRLITAFYSWDETAYCDRCYLGYGVVDGQYACVYTLEDDDDLDTVEQFLTEQNLNCSTKVNTNVYEDGFVSRTLYVILNGRRTFGDLFDAAAKLYGKFGYCMWLINYDDPPSVRFGQNALALLGDVNLDCSVDVSDAVLTARYIAEDSEAALTECGLGNADTNEDGTVTLDDVTLMLQYLAKKIS